MAKRIVVDHANHILEHLRDVAAERGLKCFSWPDDLAYKADWREAGVWLTKLNKKGEPEYDVAQFRLQQMPGCCAILTMSYVETKQNEMTMLQVVELVAEAAKLAAFGSLCLTQVLRRPQPKYNEWYSLVTDGGFLMSEPFINAKSGNSVVYLTRDLGQARKMDGFEDVIAQPTCLGPRY